MLFSPVFYSPLPFQMTHLQHRSFISSTRFIRVSYLVKVLPTPMLLRMLHQELHLDNVVVVRTAVQQSRLDRQHGVLYRSLFSAHKVLLQRGIRVRLGDWPVEPLLLVERYQELGAVPIRRSVAVTNGQPLGDQGNELETLVGGVGEDARLCAAAAVAVEAPRHLELLHPRLAGHGVVEIYQKGQRRNTLGHYLNTYMRL